MIVHRASISPPDAPIGRIVARLISIRRGIAARTLAAGLAKTLWTLLALAAIDLAIDRVLRLDFSQRAVMLAILLSSIVWLVYRWLWIPLGEDVSDDALALAIEAANPRLQQSLITALQLSRQPDQTPGGVSRELRQQAIRSGCKRAEEISFDSILDSRHTFQNAALLAAAAFCIVACLVAFPFSPLLRTWFNRNVLLSRATWPQQTYLTIERLTDEGTVVFPRGSDWTQAVEVSENSAVVPDAIYLEIRQAVRGKRRTSLLMDRLSERRFESAFHDCLQPFEFRARGGDAVTNWVRVELVDPPDLRKLTITVVPPKYSGEPTEALAPGQSAYQVLRGSSLRIDATPNKPLEAAEFVHEGNRWKLETNDSAQATQLSGQIPASKLFAGAYAVELADTLGLSARAASFSLRWQTDREPRVTAQLDGIRNLVLPQAKLPVHCQASDDYGLCSLLAVLTYAVAQSEGEPNKKTLSLVSPGELGAVGAPSNRREVNVRHSINLEPLQLPVGSNLRLQFEAADNNDITGPSIGRSAEFFLRVVDEAEFRSDLLRREKAERQELERLWKAQDDLTTDGRALVASKQSSGSASSGQLEQWQSIYRGQKQIGQKLTIVAERIAELAAEIGNNQLPDPGSTLQNRLLTKIAQPLKELTTDKVPPVMQALDRARQIAQAEGSPELVGAIAGLVGIANDIKRVLEQMLTSEGYQEAIDLLYDIQKAQSDVFEQTNQAREQQIKRILEGRK